jgi:integrase
MNFGDQSAAFLNQITTRKRKPVKPATVRMYSAHIRNWIVPRLGAVDLADFNNGAMKRFVESLTGDLGPSSIGQVVALAKKIVASAVGPEGDLLYPRTWNAEFIDLPTVPKRHGAVPTQDQLTAAMGPGSPYRKFWALLAGTGLRIGEALAVRRGYREGLTSWDPERSLISVRTSIYMGREQSPKTPAAIRDIDLDPQLNQLLAPVPLAGDLLFSTIPGGFLSTSDMRLRFLDPLGIQGFHSFRRFRMTHLRMVSAPEELLRYWMGHASTDWTHDRYSTAYENIQFRKTWAEKVGLGFSLPQIERRIDA